MRFGYGSGWRRGYLMLAMIAFLSLLAATQNPLGARDTSAAYGQWGVETTGLSATINPGDDFYRYVNEGWIERTPVPLERGFTGEPWIVQDKVLQTVSQMLLRLKDEPRANAGSAQRRVQDFYAAYTDLETIETRGLKPIQSGLDQINAIDTSEQMAAFMAHPMANSLFHTIIKPPVDMSGGYVLSLEQYRVTGLGLPAQWYYLSASEEHSAIRQKYRSHIAKTLSLAGFSDADLKATKVLKLEIELATRMWDLNRLRDASASFELVSITDLQKRADGFPWQDFLEAKGLANLDTVNFGIGALSETAAAFDALPLEDWKAWAAYHWVNNHADYLPIRFRNNAFDFYERELNGAMLPKDREEAVTDFLQDELGADIGALYVSRHFSDVSLERIEMIGRYVRQAFQDQLRETPWMDSETRAEALRKIDAIIFEYAEPSLRTDLSAVQTDPKDLIGSLHDLRQVEWEEQRGRIGKLVNRLGDWNMSPHRIGLGYHQQYNKIFITAGALRPPFFDANADIAVNFGSIGSAIAHEIGHAFDDQGAKFDSAGALRNWWTPATRAAHKDRLQLLIDQFAKLEPAPGIRLQSEQMIGEIVADLSGALVGYRAYQLYLEDHPEEAGLILDGFSGNKRYWLGLAQKERMVASRDAWRMMATQNSHPPGSPRVNGVVSNLNEWYRDFEIGPNDPMYRAPKDRVRMW